MMTERLLEKSPNDFILFLKKNLIKKFFFVFNPITKKIIASHKVLNEIAEEIQNSLHDFENHEGIFIQLSSKNNILLGAFIHRTNRGQAAGGVRNWNYDTMLDYFTDGMRLAKGMTHKNALAGLWWGGGKGVIANNPKYDKNDIEFRKLIYSEYGKFITSLNGCYITAEDVGTSVDDMATIFSNTRFTTCIPNSVGGSGNPSIPTAKGVVAGMEAALEFIEEGSLEGKTIAVQGLGHVAIPLIQFLFEKKAKKIIACDIFEESVQHAKREFRNYNFKATLVEKKDSSILETSCDILAPCATGAILNSHSIPKIKAKIICGATNNQLESPESDDDALMEKGIVYIPDFLTNRMGIVNCADEQAGYVENDPIIERHLSKDWKYSIHQTTLQILDESKRTGISPGKVALKVAHKLSLENNPIYGHRGKLIIESLVKNNWEQL
jgi:glutamate dehydrogenase/leucine dehydrogenase